MDEPRKDEDDPTQIVSLEALGGTSRFQAGLRLGDLELVREVGRGGQAIVFEAKQGSLDRTVAVKILSRDLVQGDEQDARFRREAEATGRLQHANIVAVYEFREVEGHPLIVEELVKGQSLEKALEERREKAPEMDLAGCTWAAHVCAQLGRALHHAHEAGVVHRDMKPENVLLTPEGVPKIADFGLAKVADKAGLSMSGTIVGTPFYMSPEQVDEAKELDHRSDVYSLGATLYRMLTHRVPVRSKNLEGIFLDILHRPPTPVRSINANVPRDLEAVCLKALEKLPRNRYESAEEMAEDLERFLAGEPTSARPVSGVVRAVRTVSRMAQSTLLALVLLVPALWVLLDLFLLAPMGVVTTTAVATRLGVAALGAVLWGGVASLLAVRWAGGKRWATAPVALVALLLAAGAGWRVLDQRMGALQRSAREDLALQVELSERRDVDDLRAYAAAWGNRFDAEDYELLARAYLKRGRGSQASEWVQRGEAVTDSPVFTALAGAVVASTGEDAPGDWSAELSRAVEAADPDATWSEWKRIGDVLRTMDRPDAARLVYLKAGGLPGADRDLLNLDLGWTLADQCAWDDAADRVDEVLGWKPDDPRANYLAARIAVGRDEFGKADGFLTTFEDHPRTPRLVAIVRRYQWFRSQALDAEATAWLERAAEQGADDPEVQGWVAREAFVAAKIRSSELQAALGLGESGRAQEILPRLLDDLRRAERLYERVNTLDPENAAADIGLSAVHLELARYDGAAEHLDAAVAAAESARRKDPTFWEAHANVAQSVFQRAMAYGGGFEGVAEEELRAYVDGMSAALELNSLDPKTLNDTAYVLGQLAARTGDRGELERALGLARRATRLLEPPPGDVCGSPEDELVMRSSVENTLAQLLEQAGDLPAALEAARRALELLDPETSAAQGRRAEVQRLEEALGDR